jgi:pyruvate,water dikinase
MHNEAARRGLAAWPGPDARLSEAARPGGSAWRGLDARIAGDKAARLARAAAAGLPVLPGWVVPVAEGGHALSAAAAAVRAGRPAAARRAVLGQRLDDDLAAELREAVTGLGGRVIVRSSSPLEGDPRWSGAFSSVAEVGPGDVRTAVRSCWASAFAVDPLGRLEACGLPPEALELGVLLQPEIRPAAGGVARVTPAASSPRTADVTVEGVLGHPGALLSGWAAAESARVRVSDGRAEGEPVGARLPAGSPGASWLPARDASRPAGRREEDGLIGLIGQEMVAAVAALAGRAWRLLGDDVIEWAADDGGIWLLQSRRSTTTGRAAAEGITPGRPTGDADGGLPASRAQMPLLAAAVLDRGEHVLGRPGAPGVAAGRLVAVRPHERPDGDCGDAILLVDQPVPALAPLLFAARGVIARTGAAGSHLAEVARSLGVPMVLGCRPERVTGTPAVADAAFLAAIDGSTGDLALLPAAGGWPAGRAGSGLSVLLDLHHPAPVLPVPGPSGQRT